MPFTREAGERAMRVHEVILRALSGELTWLQVADILGRSPRSIRRLRLRFERYGYDGLYDGRRIKPSPKRAPGAEVERSVRLDRDRYPGVNSVMPSRLSLSSCTLAPRRPAGSPRAAARKRR